MPAPAEAAIAPPAEVGRVSIFTTRRISWREGGETSYAMAYALVAVPADVAERAIARDLACAPDSAAARAVQAVHGMTHGRWWQSLPDAHDLDAPAEEVAA